MKNLLNRLIGKGNSEKETGHKTGQAPYALPKEEGPKEFATVHKAAEHLGLSEDELNQAIEDNVNYINDFRVTLLEFCAREYRSVHDSDAVVGIYGISKFHSSLMIQTEDERSLILKEIANVVIPNLSRFCETEYELEIEIARTNRLTELVSIMPVGLKFIDPLTTNTYPNDRGMQTYDATKNTVVNSRRYNKLKAFYDKHASRVFAEEKAANEKTQKEAERFQNNFSAAGIGGTVWPHDDDDAERIKHKLTHLFKHFGIHDPRVVVETYTEDFSAESFYRIKLGIDEGIHGAIERHTNINKTLYNTKSLMASALAEAFFCIAASIKPDNPPSQRLMSYAKSVLYTGAYDIRFGVYN